MYPKIMTKYFRDHPQFINSEVTNGAHLEVNQTSVDKNSVSKNKSVANIDDPVLFKSK